LAFVRAEIYRTITRKPLSLKKGADCDHGETTKKLRNETRQGENPNRRLFRVLRRGLIGFAGLAPHFGRSPNPVPSIYVPGRETFRTKNSQKSLTNR